VRPSSPCRRSRLKPESFFRPLAVEYLQVKTLGPSYRSPDYARTRRFYESRGFRPLEEIKGFWNEENPCLIMVKHLAGPGTVSP
jgi:hypothetical protein